MCEAELREANAPRIGGEGGIRTHGAFAHRFSRAAPSTTRTPLRRRGYQRARAGPGAWAGRLAPAPQGVVLGQLDDGSGRAVVAVRDREDERLDVALEQRADAHRAGLKGGE